MRAMSIQITPVVLTTVSYGFDKPSLYISVKCVFNTCIQTRISNTNDLSFARKT